MSKGEHTTDLFTQEALLFHAEQNVGRPSLLRPLGFSYITALLCITIISGITFLASKEYTRKETVSGTLIASVETKRVFPEKVGILSRLLVQPGDLVEPGDVIAQIHSNLANQLADGTTSREEYDHQIQQHLETKRLQQRQSEQKVVHLGAELQARGQQLNSLEHQLQSQSEIVERSLAVRSNTQQLFSTGQLSTLEWNRLDEHYNQARQRLEELKSQQLSVTSSLERLQYERDAVAVELAADQLQLDVQITSLKRSRNRLIRETNQTLLAPIGGKVATVFVTAGATVSTQRPIVSIQPMDSELQAQLYLPGHAIGFIKPGQTVNLLYDAFPYQQFGSYEGELNFISSHPVTANDTTALLPARGAFYLAKVRPGVASVSAYGNIIPLKEGMSLKADIVLDRRSLLAWLFEPLLIHRGRSKFL